jgi:DNA mismatch repair ATPase MutS
MNFQDIIDVIRNILTLFGIVFAAFLFLRNPQTKSETFDAVISQRFEAHEKSQTKEFETFDARLLSLNEKISNLRDNHIHSIDIKLDGYRKEVQEIREAQVRIETILNERLPKKQ